MNTKQISFRPCTPSDASDAVPLIFQSGPDAFNYVFKTRSISSEEFLVSAFVSKGGEFSFDNHYVMILGDKIVGIGAAFSARRAATFTFSDLIKIVKFYGWNCIPVLIRGLRIEQIIKLPIKDEISLAHITIHSEYRSHGYGQQLLEFLMSNTPTSEKSEFVLDVSEMNPRAKSLYERLGFRDHTFNKSNLTSEYGLVYNHYRMHLTISAK